MWFVGRIVNGAAGSSSAELVGMVHDGSRCDIYAMCLGGQCVSMDHVMPLTCVTGHNGLVCSGHGVGLSS